MIFIVFFVKKITENKYKVALYKTEIMKRVYTLVLKKY